MQKIPTIKIIQVLGCLFLFCVIGFYLADELSPHKYRDTLKLIFVLTLYCAAFVAGVVIFIRKEMPLTAKTSLAKGTLAQSMGCLVSVAAGFLLIMIILYFILGLEG
jgi:hypothetical protein